jgi:predicted DNA-binding protein YlxM (UPF0122 family)
MATITIKIESEQLAREVLTQLGYLPDEDDAVPDLISGESEDEEVRPAPKTHIALIHEHMADILPRGTRKMPDTQKQSDFCTTEDPKEDVEPVENELGASLDVFSEETAKERDAIYQQCMEVRKSLPSAEERLKATADQLMGEELLDYLDAMCEHNDKKMREAAKAMVRKEFAGHTLKMWPNLRMTLNHQG